MDEVKEVGEVTVDVNETPQPTWSDYVRSEVAALLDTYLPSASTGNVGIRYKKPVIATDEAGMPVEFDNTKAEAVSINLVFEFDEAIDISNKE